MLLLIVTIQFGTICLKFQTFTEQMADGKWLGVFKIAILIQGFDARLTNRPFVVLDVRAFWRYRS